MDGVANLAGWRWIFILEGAVTVLSGLFVPWLLPDSPERANWLTLEEKRFLRHRLEQDSGTKAGRVQTLDKFQMKYLSGLHSQTGNFGSLCSYFGEIRMHHSPTFM